MSAKGERKRPRKDEDDNSSVQRVPEKLSKSDVICPICFDVFEGVQVTKCGHSFCHDCILKCLSQSGECPVCKANLTTGLIMNKSFVPNFSLNDIVVKVKSMESQKQPMSTSAKDIMQMVESMTDSLTELDWEQLHLFFTNKRGEANAVDLKVHRQIYANFLRQSKKRKLEERERIDNELKILDKDLEAVAASTSESDTLNDSAQAMLVQRTLQLDSHFEDLQQSYFALSSDSSIACSQTYAESSSSSGSSSSGEPTEFQNTLRAVTKYSSFQELATLHYGDGPIGVSSIVSSIEFDKDGDLFAVGGVTKKVKIFDYASVTSNQHKFTAMHYPVREIPCHAKISSVAYSPYNKPQLATSDYDGTLSIWDTNHVKCVHTYQEHEKRVWSVSYNSYDPALLATGGDDCSLKLWHLTLNQSIQNQPTRANVCSVRFQPGNKYYLAYGSADHIIRLVDIRKFSEPVLLLKGHKKAVSYVQYLNDKELVSASTDSELKLWSVETGVCLRTYRGHCNDKNFVGLSVNNGYITCGSENNSFYVYEKYVCQPILKYKFRVQRNILPGVSDQQSEDGSEFVSAVCSRKNSKSVVAANSQGFIKVLEMV